MSEKVTSNEQKSEQIATSSASNKHKIVDEESIEIFKNLALIENI